MAMVAAAPGIITARDGAELPAPERRR